MGGDPVMQVGIAQGGIGQQGFARHTTVVRQVIAGHHGKGRGARCPAPGEGGKQHAEYGPRLFRVSQILLDLGQGGHEFAAAVVDAITAFGDGQRDDADIRAGELVEYRLDTVLGQQHVTDRADDAALGIVAVAQFEQGVEIVLPGQVIAHFAVL